MFRHNRLAIALGAAAVMAAGCAYRPSLPDGLYAQIDTAKGAIICRLEYQKAPMTVMNFVGLAEGTLKANGVAGKHFFDGLKFHRVEPGFVVQGGDPKGDGTGGPGYQFPNEIASDLKHDGPGVMAMANAGPDTNGSQFYITLAAASHLDGGYSIFGRVVQGMDVAQKIAVGDVMKKVTILRVGADAKAFLVSQERFDALVKQATDAIAQKARKAREADLATIAKKWPNLRTTPSGLMYEILTQGKGGSPANGASVVVNYTGWLLDGTRFDSSLDRGQPATFRIGEVIEGWNEALRSMKKGEKRRLVIPPELGYGARGYPGVIPADAFLVFEVELVSF